MGKAKREMKREAHEIHALQTEAHSGLVMLNKGIQPTRDKRVSILSYVAFLEGWLSAREKDAPVRLIDKTIAQIISQEKRE